MVYASSRTLQPVMIGLSKEGHVTLRTPTSAFTAPTTEAKSAKRTSIGERWRVPHLPPMEFVLPTVSSALSTITMGIITARLLIP